jgi:hypothetical protein
MDEQSPKAVLPGEDAEPAQAVVHPDMNPAEGELAGGERQNASESTKRKRQASEDSQRTDNQRTGTSPVSIADVPHGDVASYYDPVVNMAGLDDVGMEVDSAVSYGCPRTPS